MTRNVEIKARVRDLAALRKRLVEVSASGPELLVQRETFYTWPLDPFQHRLNRAVRTKIVLCQPLAVKKLRLVFVS
jgi:adenylate cyclase class IV